MKIFILDQQCIAIEGVANVLRKNGWGNIAGFANNVTEAVLWLQQNETDLIITETRFSDGSVCELIKYVKEKLQQTKILILSGENSVRKVNELFRQGISGFIDKHNNCQEILHAIACIQKGEVYMGEDLRRRILERFSYSSNDAEPKDVATILGRLTNREIQIIQLICDGHNSKVISEKLFISFNTVETHRKNIFQKLNIKNSLGLLRLAIQYDLI
ncbi:LuxR C-terminal-related transcriptional regulator [Sphingobacterium spiritivorum]|uniref:LuxR C-terminal-related transcriptional regulator n=1 Tax=Sphingobacterium spiritivorum TaxID=258 RepID=UPI003DA23A47